MICKSLICFCSGTPGGRVDVVRRMIGCVLVNIWAFCCGELDPRPPPFLFCFVVVVVVVVVILLLFNIISSCLLVGKKTFDKKIRRRSRSRSR